MVSKYITILISSFMQQLRLFVFMIFCSSIILSSCGNTNTGLDQLLQKVPSKATVVGTMKSAQLMQKMSYSDLFSKAPVKDYASKPELKEWLSLFSDPSKKGINTQVGACYYVEQFSSKSQMIVVLSALQDEKLWSSSLSKAMQASKGRFAFQEIEKKGDLSYTVSSQGDVDFLILWNQKEMALAICPKEERKKVVDEILKSKEKASVLSVKSFAKAPYKNHDVYVWVQSTPMIEVFMADESLSSNLRMLSFAGIKTDDLNNNFLGVFADFEKGEMTTGIQYEINPALVKQFAKIFKDKIESKFEGIFPQDSLNSLSTLGIDMNGLKEVLSNLGFDGFADNYLSAYGLSLNELTESLEGSLAFASYASPAQKNGTSFLLALDFKKPEFVNRLIQIANKLGMKVNSQANTGSVINLGLHYKMKNNLLVIGNDQRMITNLDKGNNTLNSSFFNQITEGYLGTYVNFSQLNQAFQGMSQLPLRNSYFGKLQDKWTDLQILDHSTAVIHTKEAKAKILMKDKNQNSLKSLGLLVFELAGIFLESNELEDKPEELSEENLQNI